MTKVCIIKPKNRSISAFNSKEKDLSDAFEAADLPRLEVDHGYIAPYFMIIVYEFGLFSESHDEYFRLGKQLFNGNAICYHTDNFGEANDFPQTVIDHWQTCKDVEFFSNLSDIESAIADGRVARPCSKINGEIVWQWTGASR